MNVCLANVDYLKHTSTEGNELQEGLRHAGWVLSGVGYDGLRNVEAILDRYKPERIFVQDVRDWLPASNISFRKDIGFDRMHAIGAAGVPAFTVIKDAWGWEKEQSGLARGIRAKGIAAYYRTEMVRQVAPWIESYSVFRIHHSVDADLIRQALSGRTERRDALVSGFLQPCYPIREAAFREASLLGLDVVKHPGYGNAGQDTPNYLRRLLGYKVHLATSSRWGCAFRKIIESVACGLTPVTNLPAADILPEIDGALVRIPSALAAQFQENKRPPQSALLELKEIIRYAVARWNLDERMVYAQRALHYYDWKEAGARLSRKMETYVQTPPLD